MKSFALTAASVALTATTGIAGGIDRSGQDISILFEKGNHVQLTFASVSPNVEGTAVAGPADFSQSAIDYKTFSFGVKKQINENLSFAIKMDEPYGADIRYKDGALSQLGNLLAAGASLPVGHPIHTALTSDPQGRALVDSKAIRTLLRYEFGNGFSVHGGLRAQRVSGEILSGDGLLQASSSFDFGYSAGVAYERPDIALRVDLTYNSAIDHDLAGTHNLAPATGKVRVPESYNLNFQTGIAQNTLLFGKIRHVAWAGTKLQTSSAFGDIDWVEFTEDSTSYELGLGRKLNDRWSIAATIGYEEGSDTGTTFLAPTGTSKSYGLGASYTGDGYKISGGLKYVTFDKKTVTSSSGLSSTFEGDALAAGLSLDFTF
ncbi:OmpP1/FadL family transporter [Aliiroseovarius crassostreae]|uniref:OmpP1/FadL family transporter n=1 Tax=Aliiroseovarius crassostreae TaxID=154981 RepID=UPI002201E612|nr:hypothetical protein [Aliiroseovarius crassostreae]UWP99784.1 hypothetical protein K3X53_06560 [Aliiroseovarius crassostreae]